MAIQSEISYSPRTDRGIIDYRETGQGGGVLFETIIQFQHGPVLETGHNGIQNEDLLKLLLLRMQALQERLPCRENALAITKFEEGLMWLERRTKFRLEQGVEGTEAPHKAGGSYA